MELKDFLMTDYFYNLVFEANCYRALERAGVDAWEYYGDAYEDFCEEMKGVSIDEIAGAEILKVKEAYLDD